MTFQEFINKHHACPEAAHWVADQSPEQAWHSCPRADWMMWLVEHVVRDHELATPIVRCAVDFARLVQPASTDVRVTECLALVDRWLVGPSTVTSEELAAAAMAAMAAMDAADGAAASAAAGAAWAATWITWAAADPAAGAVWTAGAARAARVAAARAAQIADDAWAAGAAGDEVRQTCADIVRSHIPWEAIATLVERAMVLPAGTCERSIR